MNESVEINIGGMEGGEIDNGYVGNNRQLSVFV